MFVQKLCYQANSKILEAMISVALSTHTNAYYNFCFCVLPRAGFWCRHCELTPEETHNTNVYLVGWKPLIVLAVTGLVSVVSVAITTTAIYLYHKQQQQLLLLQSHECEQQHQDAQHSRQPSRRHQHSYGLLVSLNICCAIVALLVIPLAIASRLSGTYSTFVHWRIFAVSIEY